MNEPNNECGIITLRNFQGPVYCFEQKPCWRHDDARKIEQSKYQQLKIVVKPVCTNEECDGGGIEKVQGGHIHTEVRKTAPECKFIYSDGGGCTVKESHQHPEVSKPSKSPEWEKDWADSQAGLVDTTNNYRHVTKSQVASVERAAEEKGRCDLVGAQRIMARAIDDLKGEARVAERKRIADFVQGCGEAWVAVYPHKFFEQLIARLTKQEE